MIAAILGAIAGVGKGVASVFSYLGARSALKNSAPMAANAGAKTDAELLAEASDDVSQAQKTGDLTNLRKQESAVELPPK